jgi:hypothetical protein
MPCDIQIMSFELKQMAWPGWFSREHFDIMEKYVPLWCASMVCIHSALGVGDTFVGNDDQGA